MPYFGLYTNTSLPRYQSFSFTDSLKKIEFEDFAYSSQCTKNLYKMFKIYIKFEILSSKRVIFFFIKMEVKAQYIALVSPLNQLECRVIPSNNDLI